MTIRYGTIFLSYLCKQMSSLPWNYERAPVPQFVFLVGISCYYLHSIKGWGVNVTVLTKLPREESRFEFSSGQKFITYVWHATWKNKHHDIDECQTTHSGYLPTVSWQQRTNSNQYGVITWRIEAWFCPAKGMPNAKTKHWPISLRYFYRLT